MANTFDRILRGIRTRIRSQTFLGRKSTGDGPVEILSVDDLKSIASLTNEDIEDLIASFIVNTGRIEWTYNDGANTIAADIATNSVGNSYIRQSAGLSVVGRSANTTGNVADITAGTDGHVLRRSGTSLDFGFLTATASVQMSTARLLGRSTAATGLVEEITLGTGLSFSGTTLNVSLSGFTTDTLPEGVTNLYFTNERAQDAVGGILTDSATIDFTYDDAGNTITAIVKPTSIDLTSHVTGTLPVANGGTGRATNTPYTVLLGNGSSLVGLSNVGTDGQFFVGRTTDFPTFVTMSGDATIAASGALTIGTNKVTLAKIAQGTALSVLGVTGNATANYADMAAGADYNIMRRSGTAIAFGSIDLSQSGAVGSSVLGTANGGTGKSTVCKVIAYLASDQTDVTGDGTAVTIVGGTEEVDSGGNHATATGIFTAPTTDDYVCWIRYRFDGITGSHTSMSVDLVTTGGTHILEYLNPTVIAVGGVVIGYAAMMIRLTAADTAKFQVTISGGTKVVDILSGATNRCRYGFYRVAAA